MGLLFSQHAAILTGYYTPHIPIKDKKTLDKQYGGGVEGNGGPNS